MLEQQEFFKTTRGRRIWLGELSRIRRKIREAERNYRVLDFRGVSQYDAGNEELFNITTHRVLLEFSDYVEAQEIWKGNVDPALGESGREYEGFELDETVSERRPARSSGKDSSHSALLA